MGAYTDKLKIINKEIDELLFLLKICIDKKTGIEELLEELSILDNEVVESRIKIISDDVNVPKLLKETCSCNKETMKYILKTFELNGLLYQLNDSNEFENEVNRIHDTRNLI